MPRADFDHARLCRLNGAYPTLREKWKSWYRVTRLARRDHPEELELCLHVLLPMRWVRALLPKDDPLASRLPVCVRRDRVLRARAKRREGDAG